MKALKEILEEKLERGFGPKYVSAEFQDYGFRLAQALGDLKQKALYIKLAKEKPRHLLEQARDFALGYEKARSRAKIFMRKLKELLQSPSHPPG
jgi:hypothetical protein